MKRVAAFVIGSALACNALLACNAIFGIDLPSPEDASIGRVDARVDAPSKDANDAAPDAPSPQDDDADPFDDAEEPFDDAEVEDAFNGTVIDASCDLFDHDACAGFDAGPEAQAAGCYWDYYETAQCEAVLPTSEVCTNDGHCPSGYGCFVRGTDFDASTPGQCLSWCHPDKDAGCEAGTRCQTSAIGNVWVNGQPLGYCLAP